MSVLLFTIGEIAQLVGTTAKTIRHYHDIGLLSSPTRDTNNYRLYTMAHVEQLQQILKLKSFGLSLRQIKAVFESDKPDELIRILLQQHQQQLARDIELMQAKMGDIQQFLEHDSDDLLHVEPEKKPSQSAITVLSDSIKSQSNGLADVIVEFEAHILNQLDTLQWSDGYDEFWHYVGQHLINHFLSHEGQIIFWLERYLAMQDMNEADLQGRSWLEEINRSGDRRILAQTFQPPIHDSLPLKEQQNIQRMIPMLIYDDASDLQKLFLQSLLNV